MPSGVMSFHRYYSESLASQLLIETVQESIVYLLEEVILEDFDNASSEDDEERHERLLQQSDDVARDLMKQTTDEEMYNIAVEVFDAILFSHRIKVKGISKLNRILTQVCDDMVEDVVAEVVGDNILFLQATDILEDNLDDMLMHEITDLCNAVLDHYHMRAGISRFKQIRASADIMLLDKLVLDSLLSPSDETESPEKDVLHGVAMKGLNDMILDVVSSQSLALHACSPKKWSTRKEKFSEQAPMAWFKKRFVTDVAVDVTLGMLVKKLDDCLDDPSEN